MSPPRKSRDMAEEAPNSPADPDPSPEMAAVQESFESPPRRTSKMTEMAESDEDLG